MSQYFESSSVIFQFFSLMRGGASARNSFSMIRSKGSAYVVQLLLKPLQFGGCADSAVSNWLDLIISGR